MRRARRRNSIPGGRAYSKGHCRTSASSRQSSTRGWPDVADSDAPGGSSRRGRWPDDLSLPRTPSRVVPSRLTAIGRPFARSPSRETGLRSCLSVRKDTTRRGRTNPKGAHARHAGAADVEGATPRGVRNGDGDHGVEDRLPRGTRCRAEGREAERVRGPAIEGGVTAWRRNRAVPCSEKVSRDTGGPIRRWDGA